PIIATGLSTVVQLRQTSLPFWNGNTEHTIVSSKGTLKHVQTLQLDSLGVPFALVDPAAFYNTHSRITQFGKFSSIIVKEDGSELLATTENGLFISLELHPTVGDKYEVPEAVIYPMYDTQRRLIEFDRSPGSYPPPRVGLTSEGPYQGGGKGELIVTCPNREKALRFPDGVESRPSSRHGVSEFVAECPEGEPPEAILKLAPHQRIYQLSLLAFCGQPTYNISIPRLDPTAYVYLGLAYDQGYARRFYIEATYEFRPTDMAALSNGDVMILFRKHFHDAMRIGYVTHEELTSAITFGRTLSPRIIADIRQRDGYTIGSQVGLAIREDPNNGRIFVYTVNDNRYTGIAKNTLLSTFEWIPREYNEESYLS
ncbi:hypothetical protein FOZ63_029506, partial [Perkinsus olseni]